MGRALLVAQREYVENLRTKAFWIGLFAFPAIFLLSIFVPRLLEKTRDVRRYAVIDRSDWLLEAVDERATYDDTLRLLRVLREQVRDPAAAERLPAALASLAAGLAGADDDALEERARVLAALGATAMPTGSTADDILSGLAEGERAELVRAQGEYLRWMLSLDAAAARQLGAGLDRERYQRVEIPGGVEDPEAWLRERLARGPAALFAFFVIGEDPVTSSEGCRYVSNNRTDLDLKSWFERLASAEVRQRRLAAEGISSDTASWIGQRLRFEEKQLAEGGEETVVGSADRIRQWAPVAFVYLLWISIFSISNMLLTNTIEEKSNRLIEVLLSSVSPLQLMTGKIVGIAGTGLTVIGSWVLFFIAGLKIVPRLVGAPTGLDLSLFLTEPVYLLSFVSYFLLGYLFYAALLVGVGSVFNSLKEAQNLVQPLLMIMIVPLLAMIPIGQDPNGTLAKVLSFVPPFTPFVMMNRAAGPPAPWEYVATTVLLVVAIGFVTWIAARIFRIGILMTGKPPKLTEILRWVRQPAGTVPEVEDA